MTAKEFWNSQVPTDANKVYVSDFYATKFDHDDLARFAEAFVNQEVEKRIAGVMPTKNEIGNAAQLFDKQKRPLWKEAIWRAGANWAVDIIRSRLTCSEKPNNINK